MSQRPDFTLYLLDPRRLAGVCGALALRLVQFFLTGTGASASDEANRNRDSCRYAEGGSNELTDGFRT
jgi:hypothetical protein